MEKVEDGLEKRRFNVVESSENIESFVRVALDESEPKKVGQIMIPPNQKREMRAELSPNAELLFMDYIQRSGGMRNGNALSIDDDAMAHVTGWNKRKVAKYRLELANKLYFMVLRSVSQDKMKIKTQTIFLGKGAVMRTLDRHSRNETTTMISTDYPIIDVDVVNTAMIENKEKISEIDTDISKNIFN